MSIYGFRPGPTFRGASRAELFDSAMEQPMSMGSTFWDQTKGGGLMSYGLGTAIRDFAIPEGDPSLGQEIQRGARLLNPVTAPYESTRRFVQSFQDQGKPLSQDEYKASPYFRSEVPWDEAMTDERAAALATWYDAKKVREHFASKRPFTSFLGQLAGQAVDPINYIPVAGPAVQAAAVARAGRIFGRTITGAADAAGNTALAALATRDQRRQYGDDVSWQATVSEIATAALIGSAFGTIAGGIGARRDARLEREASERLSTLRTTQEARIALNEGIDALVRGEDVNLSPNATAGVERAVDLVARDSPAVIDRWGYADYQVRDVGQTTIPDRVFHGTSQGGFDEFDTYGGEYGLMGSGTYFTEDPRIAGEYTTKGKGKNPMVYEARISARKPLDMDGKANPDEWSEAFADYIQTEDFDGNPRSFSGYTNEQMYREVEEGLSAEMIPRYEGAEIMQDGLRKMGYDSVTHIGGGRHKESKGNRHRVWIVFDPEQAQVVERRSPNDVRTATDTSTGTPEPLPEGRAEAERSIAKTEDYKALSQQYRVDPETGDFLESAEIDQLRAEGRLTPDDIETMEQAQATLENGAAYGQALRAAVACII